MIKFLLALTLVLITLSCQPDYWESDPSFQVPVNDLSYVAAKGIKLQDIEQSKGIPIKTTYTISNITATVTYDDSQQSVSRTGTSVTVSGGLLNFVFSFRAQSKNLANSSKKYNGTGTAHLNSIAVTFTKSAVIKNGSATFAITSATISNTSQIIPNGDYKPDLSDSSEFDSLIKTNLTNQLITYYKSNIQSLLTQAISSVNIPYTFKTLPYIYQFGGMNITIDTSATNLTIGQTGYVIGFNGSINGQKKCPEFVPAGDEKASYISTWMIYKIYDTYYNSYTGWQNMNFDQTNIKSSLFSFYMVDLDQILPSALTQFPNYFDRLNIKCSLNTTYSSFLMFSETYQYANTAMIWQCGLFRTAQNNNLLNFQLKIDYKVLLSQVNNAIQTRVEVSDLTTVVFQEVDGYPLQNQPLAEMYLRSIVSEMKGYSTVGSGFLQPNRTSAVFTLTQTTFKITQATQKQYQESI